MKHTQVLDAARTAEEAQETYEAVKVRAEQHVLSQRLLAMGDSTSFNIYEELKDKYEKWLAAVETYNQISRMEEINAQD